MAERHSQKRWCEATIGDLCEIRAGQGFPNNLQGKTEGDIPFAKVGDISKAVAITGRAIGSAENWVSNAVAERIKGKPFPAGSIVFAKIGEAIRLNRRAVTTREMLFDNNVMGLVPSESVDVGYLYHFMKQLDLYPYAGATTVPSIRKSTLQEIPVPFVGLNEQHRIAEKIDALQAKSRRAREALEAVGPLLEKLRQSVLAAAFRGDLTAEWREQHPDVEPAEKLLERIRTERRARWEEAELAKMRAKGIKPKDNKWKAKYTEPEPVDATGLPKLPGGWCWASVSEVISAASAICYGVIQPGDAPDVGVPLVRVCDINGGQVQIDQLRLIEKEIDEQYHRSRLHGGEVLVSVVGTIGRVAIAQNEAAGFNIARAVAKLTPLSSYPVSWLARALSTPRSQFELTNGAREVARKTLNLSVLEKIALPIASFEEMAEIGSKLDQCLVVQGGQAVIAGRVLQMADKIDQSILAKAFRGELVPQDPNDEPASVLLERIKAEREAGTGKKRTRKKAE